MYECTPEMLNNLVAQHNAASPEETEALMIHMSVRLRGMAKKGFTAGCWRLQDLPWGIKDIEAAVDHLAKNGLHIFIDGCDQTVKAFWGQRSE